ncbi:FemAB family protein [Maioricimonas rarisocia]|uniref:FemAB family protein n=1 Tax=Maioricimonas rarisocia TaxID=2528026 RepID=A0A517Z0T0_9PLAN|nr:FemAB family XrtA/PEP-CTERM system-associated protein [Maioricimonas rarisocia]QDU36082.1 FemAB family protein [Maioricimonas rarisocia]
MSSSLQTRDTMTGTAAHSPPTTDLATVEVHRAPEESAWNDYLYNRRPDAPLYHRPEWERVYGVYRLPVHRLAAIRDGEIVGILPLVEQRSRIFGQQLTSLPWFDAAGTIADDDQARQALVDAAMELTASRKVSWAHLREENETNLSPHVRTDKVLMRLQLPDDSDTLWSALKASVRNQVRKSEKSGLTVQSGGRELLDDFYRVYSHNMRDLGSPAHSRKLFDAVCENFSDDVRLFVVYGESEPVGGGLTIANGQRLEIPWASSLRKYNRLCVNHGMYWQILSYACDSGFQWFHFGRSTVDSGPWRFKKQWGSEAVPLYWYYLSRDDAVAKAAAEPPQERFGWGTRLWQRLPVPLSRLIGPRFIAKIP